MDKYKERINTAAKEALEIKKTEKTENFEIRVLRRKVESLSNEIINIEQKVDSIDEAKIAYDELSKKKNDLSAELLLHNGLRAVLIALVLSLAKEFTFVYAVVGLYSAFCVVDTIYKPAKFKQKKTTLENTILDRVLEENEDMEELYLEKKQSLLEKKKECIKKRDQQEKEMLFAIENRKEKNEKYKQLQEKVKVLIEKRNTLISSLIEENSGEKEETKSGKEKPKTKVKTK